MICVVLYRTIINTDLTLKLHLVWNMQIKSKGYSFTLLAKRAVKMIYLTLIFNFLFVPNNSKLFSNLTWCQESQINFLLSFVHSTSDIFMKAEQKLIKLDRIGKFKHIFCITNSNILYIILLKTRVLCQTYQCIC